MKKPSPLPETQTIGRAELVHQIAAQTGQSLQETDDAITGFMRVVIANLTCGKSVRLMGFGTWERRHMRERRFKPIRGTESAYLPERDRVSFKVGNALARAAK